MSHIRRYFISGLLFWLPIWVTILVCRFFLGLLDASVSLLPEHFQPDHFLGFHIPGLGVFIVLLTIFMSGVFVANIVGRHMVHLWEKIVDRIPLVRTIYMAVKQTAETLFSSNGQSFRKVLLLEYPRKGLWSIAFQTGEGASEAKHHLEKEDLITVFVPTTPNPTSGFLIMVKQADVIELGMSIEQALKFVISLGVMHPGFDSAAVSSLQKNIT